jgi:predicted secreted protein
MIDEDFKEWSERIHESVQVGVAQALERHRCLGQSIAVWRDEKVVILEADQIPPMQQEFQDSDS